MTIFTNKNFLIGAGAVVLLILGYFLFFNGPSSTPDLTTGDTTSPAELLFINLAGELDPVAFNGGVLTDPRFASLVDIRTAIIPQTSGRTDPFAPLSGAAPAKK